MELPGRLVLLGHPVAHSLSPAFQNAALARADIPLVYEALDVLPESLAEIAGLLRDVGGAGNVTLPHKERFAALCAQLSPIAERVGGVNTFWTEDGALVGDNTDVGGFDAAIHHHFGAPRVDLVVALLGAGGAAAAVLAAVERWAGARARIVSRTAARARTLAGRFSRVATAVTNLHEAVAGAGLVVNATPVGLDDPRMPVEPSWLGADADVFDLAYLRTETPWVLACRARGLRAADGRTMLIEQGALAFERWFGAVPDREAMWEAIR